MRDLRRQTQLGKVVVMELLLPKPLSERFSPQELALHLAIGLFVSEEATVGQAAQIAGRSQSDFLRLRLERFKNRAEAERLANRLKTNIFDRTK